jgi:transcription initiation factor TFIIE subunit beta
MRLKAPDPISVQSTPNPMRLQDIAIVTNTPLDSDSLLLEKFKAHDRIAWDPKTDLYSYKVALSLIFGVLTLTSPQHEFNFRNKAALLTEIQRQTRKGGGISVRALKESWKEAPAAIEELEQEGEVLVTRTVKDGQLRMVFWNEIKSTEESGGIQVEKGALAFSFLFLVQSERERGQIPQRLTNFSDSRIQ